MKLSTDNLFFLRHNNEIGMLRYPDGRIGPIVAEGDSIQTLLKTLPHNVMDSAERAIVICDRKGAFQCAPAQFASITLIEMAKDVDLSSLVDWVFQDPLMNRQPKSYVHYNMFTASFVEKFFYLEKKGVYRSLIETCPVIIVKKFTAIDRVKELAGLDTDGFVCAPEKRLDDLTRAWMFGDASRVKLALKVLLEKKGLSLDDIAERNNFAANILYNEMTTTGRLSIEVLFILMKELEISTSFSKREF